MTCQSTPRTDFNDSPYGNSYYSNETSPAWVFTDSPVPNDNLEHDQNVSTEGFFPPIPGQNNEKVAAPDHVDKKPIAMSRKGSSPGKSSPNSRLSLIAGIAKRKSRGPLPDIVVNVDDPKELKKKRNTMAARKSRDKKKLHVTQLVKDAVMWKERALTSGWRPQNDEEEADLRDADLMKKEAELMEKELELM